MKTNNVSFHVFLLKSTYRLNNILNLNTIPGYDTDTWTASSLSRIIHTYFLIFSNVIELAFLLKWTRVLQKTETWNSLSGCYQIISTFLKDILAFLVAIWFIPASNHKQKLSHSAKVELTHTHARDFSSFAEFVSFSKQTWSHSRYVVTGERVKVWNRTISFL